MEPSTTEIGSNLLAAGEEGLEAAEAAGILGGDPTWAKKNGRGEAAQPMTVCFQRRHWSAFQYLDLKVEINSTARICGCTQDGQASPMVAGQTDWARLTTTSPNVQNA